MKSHRWLPPRLTHRFGSRRTRSAWWRTLPAIAVGATMLVACGSGDDAADATSETTVAGSVLESVPASSTATPQPAGNDPSTTVASGPDDEATAGELPDDGSSPAESTVGGWELLADRQIPALPGGKSAPILSPLPDGVYWSWSYVSDGAAVEFTLSQYFTGDACIEQFGDGDGACASETGTLLEPSASVSMSAGTAAATVIVSNPDGSFDAYSVTSAEFVRLVAGTAPSADAPVGFAFQDYAAVIVTVRNGQVVAVDQIFTS